MSAIKREKDDIDVFEHTMQGVHTSENRGEIIRFHTDRGIVGRRTETETANTAPEREVEVIVRMPRLPHRRRVR